MSEDQKDRVVARRLFGSVRPTQSSGNCVPDLEALKRPFSSTTSQAYLFCAGCGALYETEEEGAETLAKKAGEKILPGDLPNKIYFEIQGCALCDGDQNLVTKKDLSDG